MPTTISIKNIPEGYQSIISNGRHTVIGDEPIPSKGTDLGFSPTDFLLAGISFCKVATIRNVARRKGWDIKDVNANLAQKVKRLADGTYETPINSNIIIDGDITDEQRKELIQEADNCYVTRLVRGEWIIAPSTSDVAHEELELVS